MFGRKAHVHLTNSGDFTICFSCGKTLGEYNNYCKECGYCQCQTLIVNFPAINTHQVEEKFSSTEQRRKT